MKEDDQASQWAERVREAQEPESVRAVKVEPLIEGDVIYERPVTRGDCLTAERPCPWASCRHHLYLDVTGAGTIKVNFPDLEVWEIPETCALDVVDKGGQPGTGVGDGLKLESVAVLLNLTRERVRQIEEIALTKMVRNDRVFRHELSQHAADEGFGRKDRKRLHVVMEDECDE